MGLLTDWKSKGKLDPSAYDRLSRYTELLVEWNARINLTGIRKQSDIEEVLVGESLAAAERLSLSGKKVLDFGSGAGVPGLIWAAYDPQVRLTSVETRQKKVAFQKEVARALLLPVEIVAGRFPDAVTGRKFDVVVSRAIRYSPELWQDALPLLEPGGILVRFAGARASEQGWSSLRLTPRSSLLIFQT